MSRVRVLNLPQSLTDKDLKAHFACPVGGKNAAPLDITDCRVVKSQSGVVRMGFVGFRTTAAGTKAVKLFNNTFIGSQKITVEVAKTLGEQRQERKNDEEEQRLRREAADAKRHRREAAAQPATDGPQVATERDQFINTRAAARGEAPTWASEVLAPGVQAAPAPVTEQPVDPDTAAQAAEAAEAAALQRQQQLEKVTDDDFLASLTGATQTARVTEDAIDNEQKVGNIDAKEAQQLRDAEAASRAATVTATRTPEQAIAYDSRRVRIANVPYGATSADVKNFVSSLVGDVAAVHLPVTRDTKQPKGVAFVEFATPAAALKALDNDGAICMGRLVRITAAPPDPYAQLKAERAAAAAKGAGDGTKADGDADDGPTGTSYADVKQEKRKKAEGDGLMWNPLFMSSAAAVSKVADRLKVDAGEIVSVNAAGAAVRAAVAEAHLTTEAQRTLSDEGINFDVLNDAALHRNRSNTTILVKHMPPSLSLRALTQMFARFGQIDTVAAPKSGALALIVFVHETDAKKAFQALAYKVISNVPLFLEWAPVGAVKDVADEEDEKDDNTPPGAKPTSSRAVDDDDDSALKTASVYITNVPFGATEDAVASFLHSAAPRLSSQPDLVHGLNVQADKGRAFVTVRDSATASYIISKLRGKAMDGRTLNAELGKSRPKPEAANDDAKPQVPPGRNPLKVAVKNLPFEATEKDLRQLFSAFTEIKAVRVPRRMHKYTSHHENNHRGFGFVEFLTEQEAANAIASLSNTHLYGRHLVLEYAKL